MFGRLFSKARLALRANLIDLLSDLDIYRNFVDVDAEYGSLSGHIKGVKSIAELQLLSVKLLISIEDRRFFNHNGVDIFMIPRMIKRRIYHGRLGGISTIEQQLVRTINDKKERVFQRKLREMFFAVVLFRHFEKWKIVNCYLHQVYLGYKIRGLTDASRTIFGIEVVQLDLNQSLFVASLTPYPLPKSLYLALNLGSGPKASVDEVLNEAAVVAPKWHKKLNQRMQYLKSRFID